MRAWVRGRVVDPVRAQLTQGVTPSRLAAALALGAAVGVFPVLGTTTALCALAGVALRLNQPAIQVANYVAYPLQLALLVPFFDLGARLLGAPPVGFTVSRLRAELAADAGATLARYAVANLRAVLAWALVAPPAAALLFVALRAALARAARRHAP